MVPVWHFILSISQVPSDRPVSLAVVDVNGLHPLEFPCYRVENYWVHAETKVRIEVHPTHWREWPA
jgi:hypothetical protein